MSEKPLVFLDANVLFSAALGGPTFELLFGLAATSRIRLITSPACFVEASANLERKRPAFHDALSELLALIDVEASVDERQHVEWAAELVDTGDVHVLAAARAAGADVLVTGDTTHFGPLMNREDLGIRVRTPRAFLLEGPSKLD